MSWLVGTFRSGDPVRQTPGAQWCQRLTNYVNELAGINGVVIYQPDANGHGAAIGVDSMAIARTIGWADTGTIDTTYDIPVIADRSDSQAGITLFADLPVITDTVTHLLGRTAAGVQGWIAGDACDT